MEWDGVRLRNLKFYACLVLARGPDLGPGFGARIWGPDLGPGFGARIRAPDPGARIWAPDLGPGFEMIWKVKVIESSSQV